jgi:hypothetical protein
MIHTLRDRQNGAGATDFREYRLACLYPALPPGQSANVDATKDLRQVVASATRQIGLAAAPGAGLFKKIVMSMAGSFASTLPTRPRYRRRRTTAAGYVMPQIYLISGYTDLVARSGAPVGLPAGKT